ncbi:hypothetical protein GRS48_08805 [Halorubrum sp. JWXQ-INN 858]|uniref:DUF5793 family protein n=1 Tax=Halorubrum sp. JWXQ-INN 858 TaxID=2690782 RepID=UPI00135ACB0E|nr:DUF5793 family protein [Halorubrum sp. JWXQ-INN 858]MWV64916.1 hypothetical protein [Halorubrum sp. JWXQ-INN 858]
MRRDYFDLSVEGVAGDADEPSMPLVRIDFHGPGGLLRERLSNAEGDLLDAAETDVAFRLREPLSPAADPEGVVGVTNRITGDFVLELNETAADVLAFIRAAREYGNAAGGDARYRVEIDVDGERLVSYEKATFLVYDHEGHLLRGESLIPSGVEL